MRTPWVTANDMVVLVAVTSLLVHLALAVCVLWKRCFHVPHSMEKHATITSKTNPRPISSVPPRSAVSRADLKTAALAIRDREDISEDQKASWYRKAYRELQIIERREKHLEGVQLQQKTKRSVLSQAVRDKRRREEERDIQELLRSAVFATPDEFSAEHRAAKDIAWSNEWSTISKVLNTINLPSTFTIHEGCAHTVDNVGDKSKSKTGTVTSCQTLTVVSSAKASERSEAHDTNSCDSLAGLTWISKNPPSSSISLQDRGPAECTTDVPFSTHNQETPVHASSEDSFIQRVASHDSLDSAVSIPSLSHSSDSSASTSRCPSIETPLPHIPSPVPAKLKCSVKFAEVNKIHIIPSRYDLEMSKPHYNLELRRCHRSLPKLRSQHPKAPQPTISALSKRASTPTPEPTPTSTSTPTFPVPFPAPAVIALPELVASTSYRERQLSNESSSSASSSQALYASYAEDSYDAEEVIDGTCVVVHDAGCSLVGHTAASRYRDQELLFAARERAIAERIKRKAMIAARPVETIRPTRLQRMLPKRRPKPIPPPERPVQPGTVRVPPPRPNPLIAPFMRKKKEKKEVTWPRIFFGASTPSPYAYMPDDEPFFSFT